MLIYYKSNPNSIQLLKKYLPHRLVIIPDVTIRINPKRLDTFEVIVSYPGGNKVKEYPMSDRVLCALRKTYKNKKGWKGEISKTGFIVISRFGGVILEPSGKYYARSVERKVS